MGITYYPYFTNIDRVEIIRPRIYVLLLEVPGYHTPNRQRMPWDWYLNALELPVHAWDFLPCEESYGLSRAGNYEEISLFQDYIPCPDSLPESAQNDA